MIGHSNFPIVFNLGLKWYDKTKICRSSVFEGVWTRSFFQVVYIILSIQVMSNNG